MNFIIFFIISLFCFINANQISIPYHYPHYKQCDPQWGSQIMSESTICMAGCLETSVSMALVGHNIEIDSSIAHPGNLNHWLRNNHGYQPHDGLREEVIPLLDEENILYLGSVHASQLSIDTIKRFLLSTTIAVIADVGHHFILVIGFDEFDTQFYVNNPNSDIHLYNITNIKSYRLFQLGFPLKKPSAESHFSTAIIVAIVIACIVFASIFIVSIYFWIKKDSPRSYNNFDEY